MQKDYKDWDAEINGLYLEINPCFCRSILPEVTSFFLIPVANSFWCSALFGKTVRCRQIEKASTGFQRRWLSYCWQFIWYQVSLASWCLFSSFDLQTWDSLQVPQCYVCHAIFICPVSSWCQISLDQHQLYKKWYSAMMDQLAIHQLWWPIVAEHPLLFLCHWVQKISLHVISGRQMLTWLLVDFPHSDIPFANWFGMELALCLLLAFGNGNSWW